MRTILYFLLLFSVSCFPAKQEFSVKNNSPQILTVIKGPDNSLVKILEGFCFRFIAEDFPLILKMDKSGEQIPLNQPGHYILEANKEVFESGELCKPSEIL